jgi:hypothetical protein
VTGSPCGRRRVILARRAAHRSLGQASAAPAVAALIAQVPTVNLCAASRRSLAGIGQHRTIQRDQPGGQPASLAGVDGRVRAAKARRPVRGSPSATAVGSGRHDAPGPSSPSSSMRWYRRRHRRVDCSVSVVTPQRRSGSNAASDSRQQPPAVVRCRSSWSCFLAALRDWLRLTAGRRGGRSLSSGTPRFR